MLSLQARMNARVDADWVAAAYPYLRAVVVEGAEAMEHHGWKWWKRQQRDLPQLQMELVDIWHFMLSALLLQHDGDEGRSLEDLLAQLAPQEQGQDIEFDGQRIGPNEIDALDTLEKLELLIALAARRRMDLGLFTGIMADCGLDWLELYRQYVGKNTLNMFRQDKGYKEGTYRKTWGGREDNEHLVDILQGLDPAMADYQEAIYQALQKAYAA